MTDADKETSAPTLQDLLARVEKATGPDLEIDVDLYVWEARRHHPDCAFWDGEWQVVARDSWDCPSEALSAPTTLDAPLYTTSLDAAVALMNRLLPGWARRVETPNFTDPVYREHGFQAGVRDVGRALAARKELFLPDGLLRREQRGLYAVTLYYGSGGSEPLALLAAILKALIGQATYPCPTKPDVVTGLPKAESQVVAIVNVGPDEFVAAPEIPEQMVEGAARALCIVDQDSLDDAGIPKWEYCAPQAKKVLTASGIPALLARDRHPGACPTGSHQEGAHMTTRSEHLAWCKARAREYLDQDDPVTAVASMMSDLLKHAETASLVGNPMIKALGMRAAMGIDDPRRFIEGFD